MNTNGAYGGDIPDVVIRRLPIYARTLDEVLSGGAATSSSSDLAERIGVTAAEVRRDLSYFGSSGNGARA